MSDQKARPTARDLLTHRAELTRAGVSPHAIDAAVSSGQLFRVRPGWYVEASLWESQYAEQQHLIRVIASAESLSSATSRFSHYSAAVLHRLPLYRLRRDERVHLTSSGPNGSSTGMLQRHRSFCGEADHAEVEGVKCTGLARTVLDVARIAPKTLALGCADAALRRVHEGGGDWQLWRDALMSRLDEQAGRRGNAQAREILRTAEPSADSVLESVSRLYLLQLGFTVRAQVVVAGPHNYDYIVDFELEGLGVLCEVDGRVKYTEPAMLKGRTDQQAFFAEKQREDWIRGSTGKRLIRWGAAELTTFQRFARHLVGLGVIPPRMP